MKNNSALANQKEFIALMAILMSLVALTIDSILPALSDIGQSLQVQNANDTQFVLSGVFFGMAFGLMIYGPLSDSFGRKPALYLGIGIFIIGDLISLFAQDFTFMVIGRIAQGFGAASCRVVTTAMIRDKFEGQQMGQVMSLIMVLFILVPALAPSFGQLILYVAHWRAIFLFVLAIALLALGLLYFRQQETLAEDNRRSFSRSAIWQGMKETFSHPISRLYMFASGIIFGSFVGYLSSSQQIIQVHYQTGEAFALYFGLLALAIGFSSFVNSKLVTRFSMEKLCTMSLLLLSILSILFVWYMQTHQISLGLFLGYMSVTFFCFGILFGNLSTLALSPLGHIAGVATSVIASIQTLISVGVGGAIGAAYDNTIAPLTYGFLACGISALLLVNHARRKTKQLA